MRPKNDFDDDTFDDIFTAHVLARKEYRTGVVTAVNIDFHDDMLQSLCIDGRSESARLGLTIRGLPTIKEQAIRNIDLSQDFTATYMYISKNITTPEQLL